MTLHIEEPTETFKLWKGEAINGTTYPRNIGTLWDEADLNAIGLYNPAPANPVAEGRRIKSTSVKRMSGVVKYVNVTEAIPAPSTDPTDHPLDGVKFRELLFSSTREAELDVLISELGANAKTKARAYIQGSRVFNWSDQYIQTLANTLSEGAFAFGDAWVAKALE